MNEHIVQQVNAGKNNLTLIKLTYMLYRVIIQVALYRTDLIVKHESVDEHRTDLTKQDR